MEVFNIKNLTFKYPDEEEKVLDQLSLQIHAGEFVVICGPSGCGKTTLLRLMKKEIAPFGEVYGEILYAGKPMNDWDEKRLVEDVGYIFQDPENQIIMEDVFQEIVFGMENLGYSNLEMKKRVAELVHTFGYEDLLYKKASELSGGQKQILNLLSVLLLKPKVLLLDEPTSQLDPIIAKDLLLILKRLNTELGMTIVLVEHRLEEVFDMADRVLMMKDGRIVQDGKSREVISSVYWEKDSSFRSYLPSVSLFYLETEPVREADKIPLNVKECKTWISSLDIQIPANEAKQEEPERAGEIKPVVQLDEVYFQFAKEQPMILRNLSLEIEEGEFLGVVGGNGSGKTTLLKVCLGILRPQRGKVKVFGKKYQKKKEQDIYKNIAYLPQNPLSYFVQDSIEKEMIEIAKKQNITDKEEMIDKQLRELGIEHLRKRHPNDCSGGEIQKAALACILMEKPKILFIDEPTKGLDPISKNQLGAIFKRLHRNGLTIVMVTHDIEFAAKYTTRSAMMFDGYITAAAPPEQLFKGNYFYTTTMNRATQNHVFPEVLTLEEALALWEKSRIPSFS